jgi:hypothetical protein
MPRTSSVIRRTAMGAAIVVAAALPSALATTPNQGATSHLTQPLRIAANGRLLSSLNVDSTTSVRPAPIGDTPRISRTVAESAARTYISLSGKHIEYFGLFSSSREYPVLKNTLLWLVDYPSARVPILGPIGGQSPPQPFVIEVNASTDHVYGAMSSPAWK